MPEISASCVSSVATVVSLPYSPEEDGLRGQPVSVPCVRLENSAFLDDIEKHLSYLSGPARSDICYLIRITP